jgi:glycosyltransferase involved in cell wall biosynthesis
MKTKRTIQFLLPGAGVAGGIKVVYQYANYLYRRGHKVRVIYPGKLFVNPASPRWRIEAPLRHAKYTLQRWQGKSEGSWFPLEVPLIRKPSLEARYIPDADITIATGNETADWTALLPKRCGEKFYFIQGYEDWLRPLDELHATYKLPLKKITISSLLRDTLHAFTKDHVALVPNGVDASVFYPVEGLRGKKPRILMLSHTDALKGVEDGFAALKLVREQLPEVVLSMFGVASPHPSMPAGTEYHQQPSSETLRKLYNSADIFLSTSRNEGFGLTALESLFCNCALVATRVGGIPDFTVPGKTALVVEPGDVQAMADALLSLLTNPDKLHEFQKAGREFAQQFTLEKAASSFERVLLSE